MRRRLAILALGLLVGLTATVAVAWAFVLVPAPVSAGGFAFSHTTEPVWYFSRVRFAGSDRVFCGISPTADFGDWQYRPDLRPAWSLVASRPAIEHVSSDLDVWLEEARGWPALALYGRVRLGDGLRVKAVRHGAVVGRHAATGQPVVLPLRPIWPGFALNVVFYAMLLGVLVAGARHVRREILHRRGRCVHCAYPRGASPVCTECGRLLVPAVTVP